MALNQRVCFFLALLPAAVIAQSSQNESIPVENFEEAPAPIEAGPQQSESSEMWSFEDQPDTSASPLSAAEIVRPKPLMVNDVTDSNPYEASVPVRSRFPEDRADALQSAMAVVLARLTGQMDGSDRNLVASQQKLINRAPQLVQQYRYETPPPSDDGFGPRPSQLRLRAEFSPSVMRREIRLAGLPMLVGERPTTLLWPLQQTGNGWQLLGSDSPLRAQWQQQASDRGFTLFIVEGDLPGELRQLPLVQLDEQLRSLGNNLVAGPHEPVRVAVATGVAQRWSELAGLQRRWLTREGREPTDGLATLLDGYAERSTAAVAVGPRAKIDVTNINSLARYAALQRYLQQLEQVQSQQLYAATGDSVTLHLRLRGDTALLRSALALTNTLQVDNSLSDGALRYRWVGN